MTRTRLSLAFLIPLLAVANSRADTPARAAVIFCGVTSEVSAYPEKSGDLWLTAGDLKRVTGFENKPEGMCNDKLCIPVPEERRARLVAADGASFRINLGEFARLLRLPTARDEKARVWYFGPRPEQQNAYLASLQAPDFTLPDLSGKPHSLSDFRGKKVLLITWASW